MKETTVQIDGIMSIFDGAGVEKQIKCRDGVAATIAYRTRVARRMNSKDLSAECGYHGCREV